MKILVFSDLHLHNWPYGSTLIDYPSWDLKGVNSRLIDGAKVLQQIAVYINDHPVDEVVFCGDLFHTHAKIDAAVLKVAHEGMNRIRQHLDKPCHMYAIVGNHDTGDKTMNVHAMHWLESLAINVIDEPSHNRFNGLPRELSFLPYTEDVEVMKRFFKKAAQKGNTTCFMHQGIADVPMGSGFLINELFTLDMVPDGIRHVFTGHYHVHNSVAPNATVIGSTMQLNWSDEGDTRGFLIIDTETGEIEQIKSDAPEFVTYDMINALRPGRRSPVPVENNFVRVTSYEDKFKEDIREELTEVGARSVEFVAKKVDTQRLQTPSTSEGFHLPSLVADYEKQQDVSEERSRVGKEIMQ